MPGVFIAIDERQGRAEEIELELSLDTAVWPNGQSAPVLLIASADELWRQLIAFRRVLQAVVAAGPERVLGDAGVGNGPSPGPNQVGRDLLARQYVRGRPWNQPILLGRVVVGGQRQRL